MFYGWVIVGVTFIVVAAGTTLWFSFPIFYIEILNEFGWGRANTAMIFSLGGIIYGISSPIAGGLFDRFGPRKVFPFAATLLALGAIGSSQANEIWQFYLFYGVILSFGVALVGFPPTVTLISKWFIKKRGKALGFAQAGLQASFLIAPLIQLLIQNTGWRETYLWLALAVFLTIVPLSILFLRFRPEDMGLLPDGEEANNLSIATNTDTGNQPAVNDGDTGKDWTLGKALKTGRFWAIFVVVTFMAITFNTVVTHQVAYIVDGGFSAMFAASLLVIFGAMSISGRLFGFVSDTFGRETIFTVCNILVMIAILLLIMAMNLNSPWMLYAYVIGFAFFAGLSTPTYGASTADLFHGKHFGKIIGFADLGWGLGTALGSWLGGYIFDTTGSYFLAFMVAIIAALIAAVAMWVAAPRKVNQ